MLIGRLFELHSYLLGAAVADRPRLVRIKSAAVLLCVGCQSPPLQSDSAAEFGRFDAQKAEFDQLTPPLGLAPGSIDPGRRLQNQLSRIPASANPPLTAAGLNGSQGTGIAGSSPETGRLQEAKSHFQAIVREQPLQPMANHRLAVIADTEQDFRNAEKHYLRALNGQPTNPDLLSDLGYSYLLQGRFVESEKFLNDALYHNPRHVKALNNLGLLYGKQNRYHEARAAFFRVGTEAEAYSKLQQLFPNGPPSNGSPQAAAPNALGNRPELAYGSRPAAPTIPMNAGRLARIPVGAAARSPISPQTLGAQRNAQERAQHSQPVAANQINLIPSSPLSQSPQPSAQSEQVRLGQQNSTTHPGSVVPGLPSRLEAYRSLQVPDHQINRSFSQIDTQYNKVSSAGLRPNAAFLPAALPGNRQLRPQYQFGPRHPDGSTGLQNGASRSLPAKSADADPLDQMPTWPPNQRTDLSIPSPGKALRRDAQRQLDTASPTKTYSQSGIQQAPNHAAQVLSQSGSPGPQPANAGEAVFTNQQNPRNASRHVSQAEHSQPASLRRDPQRAIAAGVPAMNDAIRAAAIRGMNAGRDNFFSWPAKQPVANTSGFGSRLPPQSAAGSSQPMLRPAPSRPVRSVGETPSGRVSQSPTTARSISSVAELEAQRQRALAELVRIQSKLDRVSDRTSVDRSPVPQPADASRPSTGTPLR